MYSARLRTILGAGILFAASLPFACNTELTDPLTAPGGGSSLLSAGSGSNGGSTPDPAGGSGQDPTGGGSPADPGTPPTTVTNPGAPNPGGSGSQSGGQSGGTPPSNNIVVVDNRPVTMVTSLDDNSTSIWEPAVGTIRWALVNAPTPGVIRFAVGGAIELKWTLTVRRPNLEIDGSTAPNGGITFEKQQVEVRDTHDVVLKHLRFRSGDGFKDDAERVAAHGEYYDVTSPTFSGGQRSFVVVGEAGPCRDVRIENCSIQNSTDDNASVWGDCAGITFYRCLFSGGYTELTKGLLCGTAPGEPLPSFPQWITLQQCLFLDEWARMPDLNGDTAHIVNNVIIRPMQAGRLNHTKANVVGNCLFTMPNHPWGINAERVLAAIEGTMPDGGLYVSGNLLDGLFDDFTKMVGIVNKGGNPLPMSVFRPDPLPGLPSGIVSAPQALVDVLTNVGCKGPGRDAIDLTEIDRAAGFVGINAATVR